MTSSRFKTLSLVVFLPLVSVLTLSCQKTIRVPNAITVRIDYIRPYVVCADCPDVPYAYALQGQARALGGVLIKVAENSYAGTIRVSGDTPMQFNINDKKMYDGLNDCSYTKVGVGISLNGVPIHISTKDCAAPWAGYVLVTVGSDGSVRQHEVAE
jgi:hypothetical protein